MIKQGRPRVLDANILYLIGALLFWTVGAYFQSRDLQSGLIITQYIIILLPTVVYVMAKKLNVREVLKLNKISFKHSVLAACITILTYPAAVFGNALLMALMSLLGDLNIPQLPMATSRDEYLVLMFIISISAGICEEVFFRGFVLSGYERMGKRKAIIFSAVLFGFFHFNIYNLAGPIVLGLVFGNLVIETGSIFAGIIGHMVNNGFAVTLGFILNLASDFVLDTDAAIANEMVADIPITVAMLTSTISFGIISVITLSIAHRLIKIIKRDRANVDSTAHEEGDTDVKKVEFIPLIFTGILFIIVAAIQIREVILSG